MAFTLWCRLRIRMILLPFVNSYPVLGWHTGRTVVNKSWERIRINECRNFETQIMFLAHELSAVQFNSLSLICQFNLILITWDFTKTTVSIIILRDNSLALIDYICRKRNTISACKSAQFSKLFDPILTQRVTSFTSCTPSTRIFLVSFRHHLITINKSITVSYQSNGLIISSNMRGSRENDTCDVLEYHPKRIPYFST